MKYCIHKPVISTDKNKPVTPTGVVATGNGEQKITVTPQHGDLFYSWATVSIIGGQHVLTLRHSHPDLSHLVGGTVTLSSVNLTVLSVTTNTITCA